MRCIYRFFSFRIFVITGFFIILSHYSAKAIGIIRTVSTAAELEAIFALPVDSIYIELRPGDYHLHPKQGIDTTSWFRHKVPIRVTFTYGLKITARFVSITGAPKYASMIYTHSGYGIYFEGCRKAIIQGIIITGGTRDSDTLASDAGIVVANSNVDIINNLVFENKGDSSMLAKTYQGIMGICCRENSNVYINKNQIARNTWDGISVYKNGNAMITENLIDGVDTRDESLISRQFYRPRPENLLNGGRGTGILLTRNATASIKYNMIKRYNRGIGVFVNANADIGNNVIENIKQWGICVWDADSGRPLVHIEANVIYKTGACGIGITRYLEPKKDDPGCLINNIVVETAKNKRFDSPDKFCFQCALAIHAVPDMFAIDKNVFYLNQWLSPCSSNADIMLPDFIKILEVRFPTLPDNWYAEYSEFIQRFSPIEKPVAKNTPPAANR